MKITKRQLRRIIKEAMGSGDTVEIAGTTVVLANKTSIQQMVASASERDRGARYSDTHSFMGAKGGESPEETVERFVKIQMSGMPGKITIYQDPKTSEVFGYAKYNTF